MNMMSNAYFESARRVDWRLLANSKASNPKLPNEQSGTLRDRIGAHDAGVELGDQIGDRQVQLDQAEEAPVAQARS